MIKQRQYLLCEGKYMKRSLKAYKNKCNIIYTNNSCKSSISLWMCFEVLPNTQGLTKVILFIFEEVCRLQKKQETLKD